MLGIKITKTSERLFIYVGKIKLSFRIAKKPEISFLSILKNRFYVKKYLKANCDRKLIFVIGDSHTEIFHKNNYNAKKLILGDSNHATQVWFNNSKNFCTYHLDAVTAYNSNNPNATISSFNKIRFLVKNGYLPKASTVVVSMGEIDCRVHIKKQAQKQNISIDEVIDRTISNYLEFLFYLKTNGYKVFAYGPIPSQSDKAPFDTNFPRFGTEIERNEITAIFNKKLEKICNLNGIKYFTLFNQLLNQDFTTKVEYLSDDLVHLGPNAFPLLTKLFADEGMNVCL